MSSGCVYSRIPYSVWMSAPALIRLRVSYIHIGVDSGVVCSTLMGNARASVRGIDNRRFHAFFVSCIDSHH